MDRFKIIQFEADHKTTKSAITELPTEITHQTTLLPTTITINTTTTTNTTTTDFEIDFSQPYSIIAVSTIGFIAIVAVLIGVWSMFKIRKCKCEY